jgi:uncharacterized cupredoxin-like copper-binding protein
MLVPLALVAIAAIGIGGCGGGDDNETTAATESEETSAGTAGAAGSGGGRTVEIKMGDYYFAPQTATLEAGATTIEAPNEGSVEHELVIFESDKNPAELPTEANGEVDEEKLEQEGAEEAGEIEDVEPGKTKSAEFNLKPGKYVMFCNLPGHYAQGMYGTLTVE